MATDELTQDQYLKDLEFAFKQDSHRKVYDAFDAIVKKYDYEIMRNPKNFNTDAQFSDGNTAMIKAAKLGYWEIMEQLQRLGGTYTCTNDKGYSPLSIAAAANQAEIVTELLKIKEVNTTLNNPSSDGFKATPLMLALVNPRNGTVSLLENAGARITQQQIDTVKKAAAEMVDSFSPELNQGLKHNIAVLEDTIKREKELDSFNSFYADNQVKPAPALIAETQPSSPVAEVPVTKPIPVNPLFNKGTDQPLVLADAPETYLGKPVRAAIPVEPSQNKSAAAFPHANFKTLGDGAHGKYTTAMLHAVNQALGLNLNENKFDALAFSKALGVPLIKTTNGQYRINIHDAESAVLVASGHAPFPKSEPKHSETKVATAVKKHTNETAIDLMKLSSDEIQDRLAAQEIYNAPHKKPGDTVMPPATNLANNNSKRKLGIDQ